MSGWFQFARLLGAAFVLLTSAASARPIHGVGTAPTSQIGLITSDGAGWSGATAQPANQGSSSDYGYNDPVIAQFDQPPYQDITGPLYFTVEAYHNITAAQYAAGITSNVNQVSCAADGGPWVSTTQQSVNPVTGELGYVFEVTPATFPDKVGVEVRCIAYPMTGVPLVLQGTEYWNVPTPSLFINTNAGGGLSIPHAWISATGSDSNSCTGATQPAPSGACATPYGAIVKLAASAVVCGGIIAPVSGDTGHYVFGNATEVNHTCSGRWLTLDFTGSAAEITSTATAYGLEVTNVHIKGATIDFSTSGSLSLSEGVSIVPALWLDNVAFIGAGRPFGNTQPFAVPGGSWRGGVWTTESKFSNAVNGPIAANLNRNSIVYHISSDAFQNALGVMKALVYDECDPTYGASTSCGTDGVTGTLMPNSNCITNISNPSAFPINGSIVVGSAPAPYWPSTPYPYVTSQTACGANAIQVSQTTLSSFGSSPTTGLFFDTGAHADVIQGVGTISGAIYADITAVPTGGQVNIKAQGIFTDGSSPRVNTAFVRDTLDNTGAYPIQIMQGGSAHTNVLFLNDSLAGGGTVWRTDGTFVATDVQLVNSVCQSGHILSFTGVYPTPGVTTLGGTC